jgi:hypothetical protein
MISFVAFFLTQDKYSYTTQAIAASKAQQGVGV